MTERTSLPAAAKMSGRCPELPYPGNVQVFDKTFQVFDVSNSERATLMRGATAFAARLKAQCSHVDRSLVIIDP